MRHLHMGDVIPEVEANFKPNYFQFGKESDEELICSDTSQEVELPVPVEAGPDLSLEAVYGQVNKLWEEKFR